MPVSQSLGDIIQTLKDKQNGKKTSVGEIMQAFERRGFGPLLLIPALFLVLPTGAIPGAPFICGMLILLLAGQMILGRSYPWIPGRLQRITFDGEVLKKGLDKMKPVVSCVDRITKRRLLWLIGPVSKRIVAALCCVLALLVIPLGAIPFAMTLPALAIVFFALGFSVNDGLLVAIGLGVAVAGSIAITLLWMQ